MRTGKELAWPDALIAFALAVLGSLVVIAALRLRWISPVAANYIAHAWLAAIALSWFLLLRRRFPIGRFNRNMRPWYVVALVLIALNVVGVVASLPPRLHLPGLPTLIAQLVFLAFIVGPTEELLFRGLIQTALNGPPPPLPLRRRGNGAGRGEGWRLQRGTVIGALLFGLYHLINLAYQSLGSTVQQVLSAFVIGLVFGVLYDRTRNLVGASLAHSVADFSGTAIPLLAYFVANR